MFNELFLSLNTAPEIVEIGTYDLSYVALSFAMAFIGALIGIILEGEASRIETLHKRRFLRACAALALGSGIWSMHFIGMLALRTEMLMVFDPILTALSFFIVVIFVYAALQVAGSQKRGCFMAGSALLSTAICGMHYVGMLAMKMDANIRYEVPLFLLSIIIAILASVVALSIFLYPDSLHRS